MFPVLCPVVPVAGQVVPAALAVQVYPAALAAVRQTAAQLLQVV
jgi:hypothetical protein